jgi:hypothetical protein
MKITTNTDLKKLEVSVRMDRELAEKGKSHPERQYVKYLNRALDRLNIPYAIKWDFAPVEVPRIDEGATKSEQLDAWSDKLNGDNTVDGVCKDSNILLTDRDGGGMSYGKMKGAIAPGAVYEPYDQMRAEKDEPELQEWVLPDDDEHTWFGALHEFVHNVSTHGGQHKQAFGKVWHDTENEVWYRTPSGTPGEINLCGNENAPAKGNWEKRDCLYLAECARHHLLIR